MSLDTVIKIGDVYRSEPSKAYKYHEQVNSIYKEAATLLTKKDKGGNVINTVFYNIPVYKKTNSLIFDIDKIERIDDEDKQKSLFYLNFKTSKKDAEKRYLVGDICYSHYINNKDRLQESGNYRLFGNWIKKGGSFKCAEEISKTISNQFINQFRAEFRQKQKHIEELLVSLPSVVLHFDFEESSWIEQEGLLDAIDGIIAANLVENIEGTEKVALSKYLYKTLGGVTPGFNDAKKYKNKLFTIDEIKSIMYATKIYQDPIIRINDIGIVVLPYAEQLEFDNIVDFFNRSKSGVEKKLKEEERKEKEVVIEADDMFAPLIENSFSDKVRFDIIFSSIPKSPAGVYCDLTEISNIEKSLIRETHKHIQKQKTKILEQINKEFPNPKKPFVLSVRNSFLKILGDVTKEKKKFQFHLLKVLPQIYTNTYYQDSIILPAFIEKVEHNIREGGQGFSVFKYDFYFLTYIQKNNNIMSITESKSYSIGKNLGIMAKPFEAWRDDCPIKSFEKSYVGNLSRRITTIPDLVKFAAFINEKLIMHGKLYPTIKTAYVELVETIKSFEGEKYNKHNCALGFFESYYSKININENKES